MLYQGPSGAVEQLTLGSPESSHVAALWQIPHDSRLLVWHGWLFDLRGGIHCLILVEPLGSDSSLQARVRLLELAIGTSGLLVDELERVEPTAQQRSAVVHAGCHAGQHF